MLAARVPTAISRQDLQGLDSTPTRRKSEHRELFDDLWDREVVAYAVVSFAYALGQALRGGRAETSPVGPGFALAFERTAPAVERGQNQRKRRSYEM